jgi:hypothetical protein
MGSLSNLYISSSFQSLLHFGNNNTASVNLTEIEDGFGNGLGISLNTLGDLDVERQLIVHYGAEITGAVDINTTFSGSTQLFVNQSSVNTQIRITGSYTPAGNQASISEIGIGWLVNGGAVSNARVINVSGIPNSDVTYTINQPLTANNVSYSFTGSIQREVEIEGDLNVSDDLFVGGHLIIEDGVEITGSIDITGAVTASNAFIENDLIVSGTISAFKIVTTIESASVIFSSGSNILGDSTADTQTLNGTIIMSGSSQLTGSMTVSNNISSSTLSGIGNVTTYSASVQSLIFSISSSISGTITTLSQSVDNRLDYLEGPFSTSVDFRLDELENWSSSLQTNFATTAELTQTASFLQNQINQKLNTSSFNAYTSSTNISISALNAFTSSALVTTGSNTFTGKQTYSSSVVGGVITLSVASSTASMDCSLGNFFELSLNTSSVNLNPSNIQKGQTITIKITQNATPATVTYPTSIKFPFGGGYVASPVSGAIDILTFVTYDTSSLFGVATNRLT